MFVPVSAYAQGVGASPDMLISILPFVLIFVIMYFLMIRPQRAQMKQRTPYVRGGPPRRHGGDRRRARRQGDQRSSTTTNSRSISAMASKATALRATISDVRVKGEPVANQNAKK